MYFRRLIRFTTCTFVAIAFASGCASQPAAESEPTPQSIRLPAPSTAATGKPLTLEQTVKKDLFNIQLSPQGVTVNDTEVAGIKALETLLAKYRDPVITIATHRCYSGERAAKVITLAQQHTSTPIALGSFGSYDDEQCQ